MIEPSLRVFEVPFVFETPEEVSAAHAALDSLFAERLRRDGYELLGWAEVGFVYLFSKEPVRTAADLRRLKVWLWEGDPLAKALLEEMGVSPVPLNITEVLTALQTGMVNAVYSTPYGCISLQWFTRLGYMTSVKITHAMGAVVVTKRAFDRLDDRQRMIVYRIADDVFRRLLEATRAQNREALEVVRSRGIEIVDPDPEALEAFRMVGERVRMRMTGKLYEAEILQRLLDAVQEHRAAVLH